MPEQRYTTTDRLANVIDAIQIGRKTGVLMIKRGEGERHEEGNITFVSGQIVEASVGFFIGAEALQRIRYWTVCEFLLQPFSPPGSSGRVTHPQLPAVQRSPVIEGRGSNNHTSPLFATPYRVRDVNTALAEIDQRGLSRVHRHLFLLLDGQRTIKDLIVLTGRSPNEVYTLLDQLEQAGFIRK